MLTLGCAAWAWWAENAPYEETIPEIARLGFRYVGLQSDREGRWSLTAYYTPAKVRELKNLCDALGLQLSEFTTWGRGLNHPDAAERRRSIDDVYRAIEIGWELGAPVIDVTTPAPAGAADLTVKRGIHLPDGYDWSADWDRYVTSLQRCCEEASRAGRRLALETFAGSLCSTADGFLRLKAAVGSPVLGWNLDTWQQSSQRQDPALAVHKVGRDVVHVHIHDTDDAPPSWGQIDYGEFLRALDTVGYGGVVSLEAEGLDQTTRYTLLAKEHLERVSEEVWFPQEQGSLIQKRLTLD